MTPAILDVVGTQNTTGGVTTVAYTGITVGTDKNRALAVSISWLGNPGAITVARWDDGASNQNLTLIKTVTDADGHVQNLYGLVNPINGNKTLRITWTNSTEYGMNVIALKNVEQDITKAFPNSVSATGNSAAPSIQIVMTNGQMGLSCIGTGTGPTLNSVSATQLWLVHGLGSWEGGGSYSFSSGDFSAVLSVAGNWGMIATAVAPYNPLVPDYKKFPKFRLRT